MSSWDGTIITDRLYYSKRTLSERFSKNSLIKIGVCFLKPGSAKSFRVGISYKDGNVVTMNYSRGCAKQTGIQRNSTYHNDSVSSSRDRTVEACAIGARFHHRLVPLVANQPGKIPYMCRHADTNCTCCNASDSGPNVVTLRKLPKYGDLYSCRDVRLTDAVIIEGNHISEVSIVIIRT